MFFLSWRQLLSRKKQTLLILLGISFGTLLFVSISGLQLGMRTYIVNQLLNNSSHILIQGQQRETKQEEIREAFYSSQPMVGWVNQPSGLREESKLENYASWYQRLKEDPRVRDFSPRYSFAANIINGKFSSALKITGVIPERHIRVSSITDYMQEGQFEKLRDSGNIVLGSKAAHDLGVRRGQYVQLNFAGVQKPFKVIGLVHYGNDQIDRSMAFINLTDAQTFAKNPGRITEIAVALYEIDQAQETADEWKVLSRDKVQSWREVNQSFMEMIKVQDFTRYFITITILIVASFGIYNVLSIMINHKKREIAILRAIGYGPDKILSLVLYQGLLLGIGGGILGLFLGYWFCRGIGTIDFNIQIGGSNHLLINYDYDTYATGFIAALISSIIASYVPAISASKMTPIDIIRSES